MAGGNNKPSRSGGSSSNPFAAFSATGWMTTKKRGQDDDKIRRDAKRAAQVKKKTKIPKKRKKAVESDEESYDSFVVRDDKEILYASDSQDEEELILVDSSYKKRKSGSLNDTASLSSSSSSDVESSSFLPKSQFAPKTSKPMPKIVHKKKRVLDLSSSSSDSEDSLMLHTRRNVTKPKATTKSEYFSEKKSSSFCLSDNDDSVIQDDDEANAVALAIQASLQNQPNKHKRLQKKSQKKKKKRQRVIVSLSDDDETETLSTEKNKVIILGSSDEEQEDEEVDAYVAQDDDEGAKEAQSVLEAANKLSARVLATMTSWCSSSSANDNNNNSQDNAIPQGMICNGALSLEKAAACHGEKKASSSWISNEQMKQVCPMVELANYQLVGVNWLALLHGMTYTTTTTANPPSSPSVNGVLADEMGLGKTVQTICFLAWLKHHNRTKQEETTHRRPHIIVVPASVLTNWQREFEKFCPEMTVVKYHGSMAERDEIQARLCQSLPGSRNKTPLDVVLTTFSYFSSEKSTDRNFLRRFRFDYMVVDEAHCLKNPKGMRYRNLNKFVTSHRLLLTGTPVQNSPKELMSLLCFLMPLFTPPSSNEHDFDDANKGGDGGENMLQYFVSLETGSDAKASAYEKLKQLFAPFVLRRTKAQVLAQIMPPKIRRLEKLPFDEKTRMLYDSILEKHVSRKKSDEGNATPDASAKQHLFTQLRKAANHPLLLRTRHLSQAAVDDLSTHLYQMGYFGRDATCTIKHVKQELESFSDFDIHGAALTLMEEEAGRARVLEKYTLGVEDLFCSPKFVRLRKLLPELIQEGHRVLVYSQWTRCMDLLGCLMDAMDLRYLRLDGSTAVSERQALIDEFNQDNSIPIFLLSTRAGGMGINLTAADTCLLHDVDFNPFNDLQAEDRCHRLGQKKKVTVIKMVTEGTVDMDIYNMQQEKVKMNAAILETSSNNKATEAEEMNTILDNALHRFLSSPKPKGKKSEPHEDGTLV